MNVSHGRDTWQLRMQLTSSYPIFRTVPFCVLSRQTIPRRQHPWSYIAPFIPFDTISCRKDELKERNVPCRLVTTFALGAPTNSGFKTLSILEILIRHIMEDLQQIRPHRSLKTLRSFSVSTERINNNPRRNRHCLDVHIGIIQRRLARY